MLQGRVKVEGKVVRSPKKKLPVDTVLEVRTGSGFCEYCRLFPHFEHEAKSAQTSQTNKLPVDTFLEVRAGWSFC